MELRKAHGWSQERLALESGLARSYVGGIERGQRNIALVNICTLADTLGVEPSEMLNFLRSYATRLLTAVCQPATAPEKCSLSQHFS